MSNDLSNTGIMNILIVENSKTARYALESLLNEKGYQTNAVATGPQALACLEKEHFDLLLIDVFMPLMNGYELAEYVRSSNKHYAQIPIIAYSSSTAERDKELCLKAGINQYLVKSDNKSELISLISNFS